MAKLADVLADPKYVAELDFVIEKFNALSPTERLELARALKGKDLEKYANAGRTIMDLLMLSSGSQELLDYVTKKLSISTKLDFYHIMPDAKQLNARANFLAMYFRDNLRLENGTATIDLVPIPKVQTVPFTRTRF